MDCKKPAEFKNSNIKVHYDKNYEMILKLFLKSRPLSVLYVSPSVQ